MSKRIIDKGNAEYVQQNVHVLECLNDWWKAQIRPKYM